MKKQLICIACPMGCHLEIDIDDDYKVTGNKCKRGIEYYPLACKKKKSAYSFTMRLSHLSVILKAQT